MNETPAPQSASGQDISLLAIAAFPLRHARTLVRFALAGLTVALGFTALSTPRYVAQSEFLVERAATASPYAGLAAQFGLSMPGGSMSEAFYVELVESPTILHPAVTTTYDLTTADGGELSGTLVELLDVEAADSAAAVTKAARQLGSAVDGQHDLESGLVSLEVALGDPSLAAQVNRRLLALLNEFNLERRRTRAGEERQFVAERRESAQAELIAAEAELQRFLEQNRTYESSPQLLFQSQRLQRVVDLRQQVFASLAQGYEQARIEEVRSSPVITLVTPPEARVRYDGREWILWPILGLLFGTVAGLLIAIGSEVLKHERRNNPERWRQIVADARNVVPSFKRRMRNGEG